jgi:hypothetical protein
MTAKTKFTLINLAGFFVVLLLFVNLSPQGLSLKLAGMEISTSIGFFLLISYLVGALIGSASLVPFLKGRQVENVAKLKEWQEQDARLAVEVQSDREKQLEAKIATLETALKQALKK